MKAYKIKRPQNEIDLSGVKEIRQILKVYETQIKIIESALLKAKSAGKKTICLFKNKKQTG